MGSHRDRRRRLLALVLPGASLTAAWSAAPAAALGSPFGMNIHPPDGDTNALI